MKTSLRQISQILPTYSYLLVGSVRSRISTDSKNILREKDMLNMGSLSRISPPTLLDGAPLDCGGAPPSK